MATVYYAETLNTGDKAFAWNGDVRYNTKVQSVDVRYIHTPMGRFGRKTGKGIDDPAFHLANAAGERQETVQQQLGRPKELQGDYMNISLQIRKDLLDKINASGMSRRQYIEKLLEK